MNKVLSRSACLLMPNLPFSSWTLCSYETAFGTASCGITRYGMRYCTGLYFQRQRGSVLSCLVADHLGESVAAEDSLPFRMPLRLRFRLD